MKHGLEIARWAFWSPESTEPRDWLRHWSRADAVPSRGRIPDEAIPAAHRRRMSELARLAVQVAIEGAGGAQPDFLVFCSQHGDLSRLGELLRNMAAGVELSPAAFSQSVHNASAGMYTIVAGAHAPAISVAAGASTFASGWLEAEGYLLENPAASVLLVSFDDALPAEYEPYSSQKQCRYALALLLQLSAHRGLRLHAAALQQEEPLPMPPLFMAWALSTEPALHITAGGQGWSWSRAE